MEEQKEVMKKQLTLTVDPYRSAPIYVTNLVISTINESGLVLIGFSSGMPLPAEPGSPSSPEALVASVALDRKKAEFLLQKLKDFLGENHEA